MEDFAVGERAIALDCQHTFHKDCAQGLNFRFVDMVLNGSKNQDCLLSDARCAVGLHG